jgi:hypothetical protein
MGRITQEQQEFLQKKFDKKLDKAEQDLFLRVQLFLHGDVKKKFISDLRKGDMSINKLSNQIFKSYYDKK